MTLLDEVRRLHADVIAASGTGGDAAATWTSLDLQLTAIWAALEQIADRVDEQAATS